MTKDTLAPWWSTLTWRRGRSSSQPDFADMGTAFGLDASLDDAGPSPAARPEPAPATSAKRRLPAWRWSRKLGTD